MVKHLEACYERVQALAARLCEELNRMPATALRSPQHIQRQ